MPADAARRLSAAPAERTLVILDALIGARFGMAQQVQNVHFRLPPTARD
jgi:hypothetical protein